MGFEPLVPAPPTTYPIVNASPADATSVRIERFTSRDVMGPGALFVATYARGSECYAGDAWAHCARYTAERMQELAREHGLDCRPVDRPHPTGQQWILLTRREGGA